MLSASAIRRALYVCLAAVPLVAQFESGTVLGAVHDPSNALVAKAKVTLTNVRTGISVETVTDTNGNYEFVNQRLGSYRVRVAEAGFQTAETEPFDLAVNARQRVDLRSEEDTS